jgi:hypothetical protein
MELRALSSKNEGYSAILQRDGVKIAIQLVEN